jgi:hypothetical protein
MRVTIALLCLVATAMALVVPSPAEAQANFIIVDYPFADEPDGGPGDGVCRSSILQLCTLRAAVQEGMASGRPVKVPAGSYQLTIGQLPIDKTLVIIGDTGATTIIGTASARVFDIFSGAKLALQGVIVSGGHGGTSVAFPGHIHGGAIHNHGELFMVESAIVSSRAPSSEGGGLAAAAGSVTELTNVTIAENVADTVGGGIWNIGSLTLNNVTVADNQSANPGGGLVGGGAGDIKISNTILARNRGSNCAPPPLALKDLGYTLSDDSTCQLQGRGSLASTPAGLAPVRTIFDYYQLVPGSRAIDAGNPAPVQSGPFPSTVQTLMAGTCWSADQRRAPRPTDGNMDGLSVCDIGAYEAP